MQLSDLKGSACSDKVGQEIFDLIVELFPVCRSITGDGVRQTLRRLQQLIPLELREVPSGAQVFDWTVPKEWNIRDAWVKDRNGERVIDFKKSNLHVLNYSMPFKGRMSLAELKPHLFTLPDHPDWVPYRTSYYKEAWGFCLSHKQLLSLPDGHYDVCVDSTLADGHLTYGECLIPGRSKDEILISTHVCHPSLANDNLSGLCTAAYLAKNLGDQASRYSYRFLFIPGTIGAITWLSLNQPLVSRIRHGLVLTGLGDRGGFTYKKSRRGDAEIDQAAALVLRHARETFTVEDFSPYGYDERQYCSPGLNLPVGRFSRTPYGKYPEYHTSADNLDFIRPDALAESYSVLADILKTLEGNAVYSNLAPHCEPQLGKRGLYDQIGPNQLAMLWVLNYSDGGHSLLDISEKSGIRFQSIRAAADVLAESKLIEQQDDSRDAG
jgi:aminopeptidase-like protein